MDDTRTTPMGTPWAATWDGAWGACVAEKEAELGRRVCGAKTLAGTPCSLSSDHRTGRCAFHGGTDAIGAPIGNSNARVHGLYARRLQRCGTHCPMWDHCPFASAEVLALDGPERPVCAYEAEEYDRVLAELSEQPIGQHPHLDPLPSRGREVAEAGDSNAAHDSAPAEGGNDFSLVTFSFSKEKVTHHNLALLQVMVSRAAAALSVASFTDTVTSESDRYRLASTKVHAALEAYLRLSREHRAVMAQFSRDVERISSAKASHGEVPTSTATLPDLPHTNPNATNLAEYVLPMLEASEGVMEEAIEAENQRKAYMRRLEATLEKHVGPDWREDSILRGDIPEPIPGSAMNVSANAQPP